MRICTIGFTRKSAEEFFARLKRAGVRRVIDVRLNNVSQLAGFSKRDDLKYFLGSILQVGYAHHPNLAPTQALLGTFKKQKGSWQRYERDFFDLMRAREIEKCFSRDEFDDACLLCSEDKPHACHRRLVAEYLARHWGDVTIQHL